MNEKIKAYRHADTMGKSQVDLILMVYDGAIKACQAATRSYREGDNQTGREEVQQIKKFVTHLYSTLDPSKGGAVAENLGRMYVYVLTTCYLIEATGDQDQLEAITTVLKNLRSGWAELKDEQSESVSEPETDTVDENRAAGELQADFVAMA